MALTVAYVDNCAWREVSYTTSTDPETGKSTLRAKWRGRADLTLTQLGLILPGSACPIAGWTNLKLVGKPSVNAQTSPFHEIDAEYSGFKDGNNSFDSIAPQVNYTTERRELVIPEVRGMVSGFSTPRSAPFSGSPIRAQVLRATARKSTPKTTRFLSALHQMTRTTWKNRPFPWKGRTTRL